MRSSRTSWAGQTAVFTGGRNPGSNTGPPCGRRTLRTARQTAAPTPPATIAATSASTLTEPEPPSKHQDHNRDPGAENWPIGAVRNRLGRDADATGVRTAAALIVLTALLCAAAVASREPVRGPIGVETQRRSQEPGSSPGAAALTGRRRAAGGDLRLR